CVQHTHGPTNCHVREPDPPVLGAIPLTRLAVELQVTQEYTGQQKHLCYLAPAWSEILRFPVGGPDSPGSTVAELAAGTAGRPGGVVAVYNVGDYEFWTGHPLAPANLYARRWLD